jgi:hypothetical protein
MKPTGAKHVDKRPLHVDGFCVTGGFAAGFSSGMAGNHKYFV